MAEHKLSILVSAIGTAKAAKNLQGLDRTISNIGAHAGRGLRTAADNLKRLAAVGAGVAIGGTFLAIKSGLESLAERENVVSATEQAIKATGNAAKISAAEIRTFSEALESATGAAVDDKEIQAGANALLRFKALSGDTFKRALTAAVDLGAALKTGPEAAAKVLGKALVDPLKGMTMLKRAGVVLTEQEQKRISQLYLLTDAEKERMKGMDRAEVKRFMAARREKADLKAQGILLKLVEDRYKGAAEASAGPYTRALNMLSDAGEDATMALATGFLPVIERAAGWLQSLVSDPTTMANIRTFGDNLAGAFDDALDFAQKVPWGTIGDGLRTAADWAGRLFGVFTSLPPEVQGTILALGGLDRLTGGAIGGIVSEIGKGLIKGVLGINAAVVNVNGGVVKGGGLPGGGALPAAGGAAAAGGAMGMGTAVGIGAASLVVGLGISQAIKEASGQSDAEWQQTYKESLNRLGLGLGGKLEVIARNTAPAKGRPDAGTIANDPTGFLNSGPMKSLTQYSADTLTEQSMTKKAVDLVRDKQSETLGVTRDVGNRTQSGLSNTARSAAIAGVVGAGATTSAGSRIVGAIQANRPIVTTNVTVNVTASGVQKTVSTQEGYGKATGSGGGGNDHPGGGGP